MSRNALFLLFFLGTILLTGGPSVGAEIHDAARDGDTDTVKKLLAGDPSLLNATDENGNTALHLAASGGHPDLARWLVEHGADVVTPDFGGVTALHYAVFGQDVELTKKILDLGAAVDFADIYGNTPLIYAAYVGSLELVKLLHSRGASVDHANISKQRPLHFAARSEDVALARYIVESGADINARDHYGRTAASYARIRQRDETVKYLMANGAVDDYKIGDPAFTELAPDFFVVTIPFSNRTNMGILKGKDGVLLVDTGLPAAAASLKAALEKSDAGEVRAIVNTHLHADHTGANSLIDSTATVFSFASLDSFVENGLLSVNEDGLSGHSGLKYDKYYYFTFDGREIRIIPATGTHSDSDVIVYIPGSNVACMGSLLISEAYPAVGAGSVGDYVGILDTALDVFPDGTRFVAGHGRPIDKRELRDYRKMVVETVEAIRAEKKRGRSLDEIVDGNVLKNWADYGRCPFLPYITDRIWINTVYHSQ